MKRPARARKAGTLVLDASVALAWCFEDEHAPYADSVARSFPAFTAIVPALWRVEVGNAFLTAERRRRSAPTDTQTWLRFLGSLPIRTDDATPARAWSDAIRLARSHDLSLYDACYLELALRRGVPLATLDEDLETAADAVGVRRFRA